MFNEQTEEEIKTNQQGGGCCPKNKPVWDPQRKECREGQFDLCTTPWIIDHEKGHRYFNGKHQYCEEITKGMNYGIWKDVIVY